MIWNKVTALLFVERSSHLFIYAFTEAIASLKPTWFVYSKKRCEKIAP